MTSKIVVPGYGAALASLDWLTLASTSIEGRGEIQRLGRGVNAAWQFVWSAEAASYADSKVAFATKIDSTKKPTAAGALLAEAIPDSTYLLAINDGNDQIWIFGVIEGMPANRCDIVCDDTQALSVIRDYLSSVNGDKDNSIVPVYTDRNDLFNGIPYEIDLRLFSLEILGHSIKKKNWNNAKFATYSTMPKGLIGVAIVVFISVASYAAYEMYTEDALRKNSIEKSNRDTQEKIRVLKEQIDLAINVHAPANVSVHAYLNTMKSLPMQIEGWHMKEISCSGNKCVLTFNASSFATWKGYVEKKPASWPYPILGTDIQKIEQEIMVTLPNFDKRNIDSLPEKKQIVFDLGNLAQLAKNVGIHISLENNAQPVAVDPGVAIKEKIVIHVKSGYAVTGPAAILGNFTSNLPKSAGVTSLQIKIAAEKTSFELKGEAYARP